MSDEEDFSTICEGCQLPFDPALLGGLCPWCTTDAAMRSGRFVGDYELLQELGEGGMSTVHIAKHREQDTLVALKLPKPSVMERAGLALSRREIQTASGLVHPNIVRTLTSGTHYGQPFLVMQLLEGGTLADPENRARHARPKDAVELMIKIARAVEFAHQRAVIHCDLKASNILMDAADEPYVSDFGLSRELGASGAAVAMGGSRGWMSPEQASGEAVSTASDVFSLGVMLSWLLRNELPFGDGADFVRRVAREPRPSPGPWRPTLKWALEAIAEKAMQVDPKGRYRFAAGFADDLERASKGMPIIPEEGHPVRRAIKWIPRHAVLAAAAVELALIVAYLPLIPLALLGEVRNTFREANRDHVRGQAGAVMNELRTFAEQLEVMAERPEIRALVDHEDVYQPPADLIVQGSGFDLAFVLDASGTIRARWPGAGAYRYPSRDFGFRDYFRCQDEIVALRNSLHGRVPRVCVSRAFHNKIDEHTHIAFSAPLWDDSGRHVGARVATTKGRSTFGAVQMNCSAKGDCATALLGRPDRNGGMEAMPTAIQVLAEPGLREGSEPNLPERLSADICSRFGCERDLAHQFDPRLEPPLVLESYDDPVSHQPSLAAISPVGGTGLVVVVATPNATVDLLAKKLTDKMKSALWVPGVVGALLLVALLIPRLVVLAARVSLRQRSSGG